MRCRQTHDDRGKHDVKGQREAVNERAVKVIHPVVFYPFAAFANRVLTTVLPSVSSEKAVKQESQHNQSEKDILPIALITERKNGKHDSCNWRGD